MNGEVGACLAFPRLLTSCLSVPLPSYIYIIYLRSCTSDLLLVIFSISACAFSDAFRFQAG